MSTPLFCTKPLFADSVDFLVIDTPPLLPVTDGDRTFWHWESRFSTRPEDKDRITQMVSEDIYQAGFEAIRRHLKEAA